jgi:hypothetical protein
LAGEFDGVNVLVAAIVTGTRVAFTVLVRHGATKRIKDGARSDIFGGDEDD